MPAYALAFLIQILRNGPGPCLGIIRKGWDKGISGVVMDRAAEALGVVETGAGDGTVWALPKRKGPAEP